MIDDDKIEDVEIDIQKLPLVYTVINLPPPGLWSNAAKSELNPPFTLTHKGDLDAIGKIADEYEASSISIEETLYWGHFSILVAKICHGYAVSLAGIYGIEFYLPDIILGKEKALSHYVGGIALDEDALPPNKIMGLSIKSYADEPYLVGTTTFFNGLFPTYEAVVGKILDFDLITKKMR